MILHLLPTPRFSRGIGLVLDLFRGGEKSAVAGCGFLGFLLCACRYFGASSKTGDFYVMHYIKYYLILRTTHSRFLICLNTDTRNAHSSQGHSVVHK